MLNNQIYYKTQLTFVAKNHHELVTRVVETHNRKAQKNKNK